MLTAEEIQLRREQLVAGQLGRAMAFHADRCATLREATFDFPEEKALLSRDGGNCPNDGVKLPFDPRSGGHYRCPTCDAEVGGERHRRHWARSQHLWLAERAAELATVGILTEDSGLAARAGEILRWYGGKYLEFPNVDNVLGPARLFFSTYLESIWLNNFLAAAVMLREAELLDAESVRAVDTVADEAAGLIGDFDEGFSNRQTWNDAALLAIAVWFHDEALAERAIESPTGVIAHLLHGFGQDGMWYEGDHYHFFAMQGMMTGAGWARMAGMDMFAEPMLSDRLHRMLTVSAGTALPNGCYPARKDARFGVSLNQPMHLESWELGLARMLSAGGDESALQELAAWLDQCYRRPAADDERYDSYLHEAGFPQEAAGRSRWALSWRTLLEMVPEVPPSESVSPGSVLMESQGLAVLRSADSYASLECGAVGGGHGHADRLHLTLFASGVHWLADPGAASYQTDDLFYYRSTMAHNSPMVNGSGQPRLPASLLAFDRKEDWAWARGQFEQSRRTVIHGAGHLLDLVEAHDEDGLTLELPWHFAGNWQVAGGADAALWQEQDFGDVGYPGIERFERYLGDLESLTINSASGERRLVAVISGADEVWRLTAPGTPDDPGLRPFLVVRSSGRRVSLVTAIHCGGDELSLSLDGEEVSVTVGGEIWVHQPISSGWQVAREDQRIRLGGLVQPEQSGRLEQRVAPEQPAVGVHWSDTPSPADPPPEMSQASIVLDHDDQYRRSESPYPGPEVFAAWGSLGWNHDGLYLDLVVAKDDLCFRPGDAEPLLFDNDPDDIHSDGLQLYLSQPDGAATGWLVVPDEQGALRAQPIGDQRSAGDILTGSWSRVPGGYRVIASVTPSWWDSVSPGDVVGFDLLINEMYSDRLRRSGQLVWSGGGGWIWLWGASQPPARFGRLELLP